MMMTGWTAAGRCWRIISWSTCALVDETHVVQLIPGW
jgi:hypothetical protein